LARSFCQIWLLLANFFLTFAYQVFRNLATLFRVRVAPPLHSRNCPDGANDN